MSFQKDGITLNAPIGTIVAYANDVIPNGWLRCDGQQITSSAYPYLYTFLTGLTTGTTNIPNLNGHFLRGTGSATYNDISYAGEVNVKMRQYDSIRDHKHTINFRRTDKDGSGSATLREFTTSENDVRYTGLSGGLETTPINYTIVWIIKT